jgi:hypothetical protein
LSGVWRETVTNFSMRSAMWAPFGQSYGTDRPYNAGERPRKVDDL